MLLQTFHPQSAPMFLLLMRRRRKIVVSGQLFFCSQTVRVSASKMMPCTRRSFFKLLLFSFYAAQISQMLHVALLSIANTKRSLNFRFLWAFSSTNLSALPEKSSSKGRVSELASSNNHMTREGYFIRKIHV